jgi:hypothetical protein
MTIPRLRRVCLYSKCGRWLRDNFAEYSCHLQEWRDFQSGFVKRKKTKNIYGKGRDTNA